jgi:hypothetical protein
MTLGEAFRLNRIEAEGWNMARGVPLTTLSQMDSEKINALNPYTSGPELTRRNAGFANLLASWSR